MVQTGARGAPPIVAEVDVKQRAITLIIMFAVIGAGAYFLFTTLNKASKKATAAVPTKQIDKANDIAVQAGIRAIQIGIDTYTATNGSAPPTADQNTLGAAISPWPKNPFTNAPMAPGSQPGDYTYTNLGGTAYSLVAHLAGGVDFTAH
jgi:preprotein translocase subunit YajC